MKNDILIGDENLFDNLEKLNLMEDDFVYEPNVFFQSFSEVEFINPELDFNLHPDEFMEWLKIEDGEDLSGNYNEDCAGMCEYASLYILMLLSKKNLKGEMKIINGNFGFWGHYWISYTYEGQEYFIDLTLQQFVSEAPRLAISKARLHKNAYTNVYYQTAQEYLDERKAFEFYLEP